MQRLHGARQAWAKAQQVAGLQRDQCLLGKCRRQRQLGPLPESGFTAQCFYALCGVDDDLRRSTGQRFGSQRL